eukprot:TRINITY_DN1080_c2_g1_i1.p1 TRINITY_DN1080_c2_g1~~TRINITY_DN1080_c2_g1_i1.p1  ORF type:complete len:307 (-),score=83.49 TRINITY_DN1080_c2_g1_i1:908-1753(-)
MEVDTEYCADFDGIEDDTVGTEKEEQNFKCLSPADIVKEQSDHINKIAEIFDIPEYTARQLLTFMKWNSDKLMERYFAGEAEQLFKESGIENPKEKKKLKPIDAKVLECSICFDDVPVVDMSRIGCGDIFCNSCWATYLSVKINDGIVTEITCPAKSCNTQLDEVTITRLIQNNNNNLIEKYNTLVARAYVDDNKNVRWCPAPNCTNAIRVQLLKEKEVVCDCGTKFCFGCGEFPHAPCDCKMIKEWQIKTSKDGDDAKWIASYTKECPNTSCRTVMSWCI